MIAELLLVAALAAGEQDKDNDDLVVDRIITFVTKRQDSRNARCAVHIAYAESRFQPNVTNGKYWGIFQLGFAHSDNWTIKRQLNLAHKYVLNRYGNWCRAWDHHIKHNWY